MTHIKTYTIINNTDKIDLNVINIQAQSNLNKEAEYRDVGRKLTKIIYNNHPSNDFKYGLYGKILMVYLPKIETTNNLIITLRRYIIDIALQAKVHNIQIQIIQL
jgi:hypothetical protein